MTKAQQLHKKKKRQTAVSRKPIQRKMKPAQTKADTLQRTIGNQAVGRMLLQRKMTLGPVGDKYEQEADSVAKQVVSKLQAPQTMSASPDSMQRQEEEELQAKSDVQRQEEEEVQMKPLAAISSLQRQEEEELQTKPDLQRQEEEELQAKPVIQRQEEEELQAKPDLQRQEEEEEVQMKPLQRQEEEEVQAKGNPKLSGGQVSSGVETAVSQAKSGGKPLSDDVRQPMEKAFGTDFSGVKIHTDNQANTLNRSLSARAFTTGSDIFFRSGEYNPSTSGGQELLAHELTHVVQQSGGQQIQRTPTDTIQRNDEEDSKGNKPLPHKLESRITKTYDSSGNILSGIDKEKVIKLLKTQSQQVLESIHTLLKFHNKIGKIFSSKKHNTSLYIKRAKILKAMLQMGQDGPTGIDVGAGQSMRTIVTTEHKILTGSGTATAVEGSDGNYTVEMPKSKGKKKVKQTDNKLLSFVNIKRLQIKNIAPGTGAVEYGHWWTEVGTDESYGWWPESSVNYKGTLTGVPGILNRKKPAPTVPSTDPHHQDPADLEFHPMMQTTKTDPIAVKKEVRDKIRDFAKSYSGTWRWTLGGGQNCHTFQEALMKEVGLKKPDESVEYTPVVDPDTGSLIADTISDVEQSEKEEAKQKKLKIPWFRIGNSGGNVVYTWTDRTEVMNDGQIYPGTYVKAVDPELASVPMYESPEDEWTQIETDEGKVWVESKYLEREEGPD